MSTNQLVGIVLLIAGGMDLLAIPLMRNRLPANRVRTFSLALATSASAMIVIGMVFLLR